MTDCCFLAPKRMLEINGPMMGPRIDREPPDHQPGD